MAKGTVENCLRFDATTLKKYLAELHDGQYTAISSHGGPIDYEVQRRGPQRFVVQLRVRWQSLAPEVITSVDLEPTTPTYGGRRWWFRCPGCERRCRVLYLPHGGSRFGCRVCLDLAYATQYVSRITRSLWKVERLRARLGIQGDRISPTVPLLPRPPEMHPRTYRRLVEQLRAAEHGYDKSLRSWLDRLRAQQQLPPNW
jgi:hypothetical protein